MIIPTLILTLSTFAPPSGWRAQDPTTLKYSSVSYIAKKTRGFTPSINLASAPTTLSLEEYTNEAIKMHRLNKFGTCDRIGTLRTLSGEGNLLRIERQLAWGKVELMQYLQVNNGKAYIMTASAKKEHIQNVRSEVTKSFRSLEIFDDYQQSAGRKSYKLKELIKKEKKQMRLPTRVSMPIVVPRLKLLAAFCKKELPEKGPYWHALFLKQIAKEIINEKNTKQPTRPGPSPNRGSGSAPW